MSLNILISSFSADDYTRFIYFLTKKNKRKDVKNIQLFKLLYANKYSSEEICKKLYPNKKKDAYHALRKRLYDSLIDFTAALNLEEENNEKIQVIKYILVGRSFIQQQYFSYGLKLLNKAEHIAKEYQLYPYLNEIYHIKIQFAHAFDELDLEATICKFKEYQQLYLAEEELTIVYAKIRENLLQKHYLGEQVNFQNIVKRITVEQNISIDETLSFKSLYQLITITSISAFVTKDYLEIEAFMMNTYSLLNKHANKERERFYHIQVLYMIANTMFRNKKFMRSLYFLDLMEAELFANRKKYFTRFQLKYELLHALNLNYNGKSEAAIKKLEPLVKKKHEDLESALDIHLSLIVFYAQQNEVKKAYKLLNDLNHTDKWYIEKVGKEWVIKKNLMEILLLIELDYYEVFENRLSGFRRKYTSFLKEINQERVLVFLRYAKLYYETPKEIVSKAFHDEVESNFVWVGAKREDIFVMSFYAWLKSKMTNKPIYEVTLELISQAQQL